MKVTDFGIARTYKKGKVFDTRILGNAGYAAPEQFGFIQTEEKADIYALGVLMNRMLTGKVPGFRTGNRVHMALIILYGGYRFPFGVRTYGNSIKTDEDRNAVSLTR